MANSQHLDTLNHGTWIWNTWRNSHRDLRPDLAGAYLVDKVINKADLSGANLQGIYASNTDFSESNLSNADLTMANLCNANLRGTNLKGADLRGANLKFAHLTRANLDGANLTEARLYETHRSGWSIKSLICESVYWDEYGTERTAYGPGDFERLFADTTKIRLFYKDGINTLEVASLPGLIKHLEDSYPICSLRLVAIRDDVGGAVVEISIEKADPDEVKHLKVALEAEAQQKVEYQRQALTERDARLRLEGALNYSDAVIGRLLSRSTHSTYNINGQAGAVGPDACAHDDTFSQATDLNDAALALKPRYRKPRRKRI